MFIKIQLKNSLNQVIVDDYVYHKLTKMPFLDELNFIENLREHSSGCAIFQKYVKSNGAFKVQTIYLHKLIAEHFVEKPISDKKLFVSYLNRNPLDCRIENLVWRSMSELRRAQKRTPNKTGYRGVIVENNKYRAVIHCEGKRYDLGTFVSPHEAAITYNRKSVELFGKTGSLNKIPEELLGRIQKIQSN